MHECATVLFSFRRLVNTLNSRTQLPTVAILGERSEAGPCGLFPGNQNQTDNDAIELATGQPCRLSGVAPEISKVAVGLGIG